MSSNYSPFSASGTSASSYAESVYGPTQGPVAGGNLVNMNYVQGTGCQSGGRRHRRHTRRHRFRKSRINKSKKIQSSTKKGWFW
jgi:hypothetical protein